MSYDEIKRMVGEIGLPCRYHHFETKDAVNPPFVCWIIPGTDNFAADGKVYQKIDMLNIELYTDQKEIELEEKVENVLDRHGIYWNKDEGYIESENMYEVLYEMEV